MSDLTVLVLGHPDDESLRLLDEAGPGVRFVVGRNPEDLVSAASEAEALFCSSADPQPLAEFLPRAPRLRWIHVRWAGLDSTLLPAIVESPATLTNSRGVYSAALGEYVVAAILFFAKDLRRMVRSQEAGKWDVFAGGVVSGSTLGIVGYGDIGRAIAERARPLGVRVLALRRSGPQADPLVDEFIPADRLGDLMARSDYVAVALPLTAETRGFVDRAAIESMKPSAVFVNVGRGPAVDEAALVDALAAGRIRGAALDVFETEPLPSGHAFFRMDNVLMSAHCADHTPTWRDDAVRLFLDNLRRFRGGRPLRNVIDKLRGY
jgi:phosphoglycerate dehydrogenase-like enzyme